MNRVIRLGRAAFVAAVVLAQAGSSPATAADVVWLSATAVTDTDQDGIPDSWETANGLALSDPTDAGKDFDGDGLTNLQEYLAGTDPNAPLNVLRIIEVALAGSDAQINFTSVTGKTYRVESADSIGSGIWNPVGGTAAGTGATVTVTNPGAAGQARRAYRVRLLP